MQKNVLVTDPMVSVCEDELMSLYKIHRLYQEKQPEQFLHNNGERFCAVAGAGVSRAMMEQMPNLEIIAGFGVGYDSIDIEAAAKRNIRVTNTPDVLNDAVAEITIGMMITLARGLVNAHEFVRAGNWENAGFPLQSELNGKTLGIVGLGRIGREIALRATAMKMRVVYHGRTHQKDQPYTYFKDLLTMADASDWLVVITTGGGETAHLINADVLKALGPGGYLVNMSRGSVLDQNALISALETKQIAGAALDVFADEPHVPEELRQLDNVVLSPHQGSATWETRKAMGALMLENLQAYFAGKPLRTPVL